MCNSFGLLPQGYCENVNTVILKRLSLVSYLLFYLIRTNSPNFKTGKFRQIRNLYQNKGSCCSGVILIYLFLSFLDFKLLKVTCLVTVIFLCLLFSFFLFFQSLVSIKLFLFNSSFPSTPFLLFNFYRRRHLHIYITLI